ncbi:uncharacterized protein BCR38DRAFT_490878 [Pseudomassariella vexata]|uniref:Uncharacterized protein n=1 Tax=Pseudomassariella vexata TaxID=1141098 RepID=A0A1Y2D9D8_9PEZI|nr:uncharacterized protein BCR38DRAFT_490878 [Pseudomassariella vexata]ORY55873.1 hypothetical protein BCR38DRAFT_490878 [Pseudomassariella vexata]
MISTAFAFLKSSILSGLQRFTTPEPELPSVPEPYIPDPDLVEDSSTSSTSSPSPSIVTPASPSSPLSTSTEMPGETLREKATKKLHGPDANPSQLGDPISLKAEQSDTVPTSSEEGAGSEKGPKDEQGKDNRGYGGNAEGGKLREKAAKKLHGPDANPSLLGDPISLKVETTEKSAGRGSKL